VPLIHLISLASAVIAAVAALAVLFRARSTLAGRLFAVGMLLLSAEAALHFIAYRQELLVDLVYWQKLRLVPFALLPAVWVTFSLVYSRGNYREYLRHWRLALVALAVMPPGMLALGHEYLITPRLTDGDTVGWSLELGWPAYALNFVMVAATVLVLMNLEQTFRASVGTQRWRLKFVILGLGALFAARVYGASQVLLYRELITDVTLLNGVALIVACALVGISLVRSGEFSIDIYPSQTALQRSVVVLAVGTYLIIVGVFAKLASWLGNTENFQFNALLVFFALVLLALALMSDRLRAATHAWLNRHFRRPHYHYRSVWESFTQATVNHDSAEGACEALARWTSRTLNALSVSVWLLDEARSDLRPAGTTLEAGQHASAAIRDDRSRWVVIVQSVAHLNRIVNLDRGDDAPEAALGLLHPRVFPNGGDRLAVPLAAGGDTIGVLLVGDRVSGVPFTSEDQELLLTVAGQAARLLESLRLAQRLMQAREMEAFQSMSTFFVHDLKNTASSLSLMLQNLPRHFDNPEFREDALRSIRKSVDRINHMIESLSALRRKLVVNPATGDLAELRPVAERLAHERGLRLDLDFQRAGPVHLDRDQLERVLTNLIVNAHEASPAGAPILVASGLVEDSAWFTVEDSGGGMTPEFVQRQLFRPFQTTKQTGTGIGLYHSKLIVDAHGGRMEVRTAPGKGTRISVILPLIKSADEARSIDR